MDTPTRHRERVVNARQGKLQSAQGNSLHGMRSAPRCFTKFERSCGSHWARRRILPALQLEKDRPRVCPACSDEWKLLQCLTHALIKERRRSGLRSNKLKPDELPPRANNVTPIQAMPLEKPKKNHSTCSNICPVLCNIAIVSS